MTVIIGLSMSLDICRALEYLHIQDPSIVHGDLNPNNVMIQLVQVKARAKIIDFELTWTAILVEASAEKADDKSPKSAAVESNKGPDETAIDSVNLLEFVNTAKIQLLKLDWLCTCADAGMILLRRQDDAHPRLGYICIWVSRALHVL